MSSTYKHTVNFVMVFLCVMLRPLNPPDHHWKQITKAKSRHKRKSEARTKKHLKKVNIGYLWLYSACVSITIHGLYCKNSEEAVSTH